MKPKSLADELVKICKPRTHLCFDPECDTECERSECRNELGEPIDVCPFAQQRWDALVGALRDVDAALDVLGLLDTIATVRISWLEGEDTAPIVAVTDEQICVRTGGVKWWYSRSELDTSDTM